MIYNYIEEEKKLLYSEHGESQIPTDIVRNFFDKVKHIDITSNAFTTFDCLVDFLNLKEIILDNNFLSDKTLFPTKRFMSVELLSLNNNKFQHLDEVITKLSWSFPNLKYLSLLGNPCCPFNVMNIYFNERDYIKYRLFIITRMPKLKFLDAKRVDKFELTLVNKATSSSSVLLNYKGMKKITYLKSLFKFNAPSSESVGPGQRPKDENIYSPLPENMREAGTHVGAYGRSKIKYVGDNSEGNRFIVNNDL